MNRRVVLLRGVNVGGKSRVVMSELKSHLMAAGYEQVLTYINSGNIILQTDKSADEVSQEVSEIIDSQFAVQCDVVVISRDDYLSIIASAPSWWGHIEGWKHNALLVIPPTTVTEVFEGIGELKDDIEKVHAGLGVLYQSMSFDQFGKTTTGKLANSPIYKRLTIRNYNTVKKLVELLNSQ